MKLLEDDEMLVEKHIFIIWQHARHAEEKIIEEISQNLEIQAVKEMVWDKKYFSDNLSRFYGVKLPNRSYKERHCGRGPFLLVIVSDHNPNYPIRSTSRGDERVNTNIFDLKELFREWTGGGHKIHATNDQKEVAHDLALLLGLEAEKYLSNSVDKWDGVVEKNNQNLVGAETWNDLNELFYVLNNTVSYLVLRNFDGMPEKYSLEEHGDIDLLTDDLASIIYISNAKRLFRRSYRVHYSVRIAGELIPFDFRYVGDEYYDKSWQKDILENRTMYNDAMYIPGENDHFYSLLYHAVVHKEIIASDYKSRLEMMYRGLSVKDNAEGWMNDIVCIKSLLDDFMQSQTYFYTDPYDLSVYFNREIVGVDVVTRRRVFAELLSLPVAALKKRIKCLIMN